MNREVSGYYHNHGVKGIEPMLHSKDVIELEHSCPYASPRIPPDFY